MNTNSRILLALTLAAGLLEVQASGPLRRARTLPLSDTECVEVQKVGNAEYSWYESADGRQWTFDGRTQRLVRWVGASYPAPLYAYSASGENGMGNLGTSGQGVVPSIGEPCIPVIMVAYADLDFQEGTDCTKVSRFLNETGYADELLAKGSVADYFRACSYGNFVPRFDVVAKVTLKNGYKHYGAHQGSLNDAHVTDLVKEAVELACAQGVDFAPYAVDGRAPIVSIIHAGPGEHEDYGDDCDDYVWAHFRPMTIPADGVSFASYIINNETLRYFKGGVVEKEPMTGIGTFCHEFGHALGLPDMYDTNGEYDGKADTPGYWDIMDYQFMYDGYRPTSYSAYERSMLGWLQIKPLKENGEYTLMPLDGTATEGSVQAACVVNPQNPSEYFIFENRRKSDFYASSYLGEGMLVWHVDYSATLWNQNRVNTDAALQHVQVVPADGQWQSVKDVNLTDDAGKRYTYPGDLFPGYEEVTAFDGLTAKFHLGSLEDAIHGIKVNDDGTVSFYFSSATGIANIPADSVPHTMIYDIQGRRLQALPRYGLYIMDGSLWQSR